VASDAPVSNTRSIDVPAPPEVVWDALTGFGDWPTWNPDVKSMSFDGPREPGSTFDWKAGPGTIVSDARGGRPAALRPLAWKDDVREGDPRVEARASWRHPCRDQGDLLGPTRALLRGSLQKTLDRSLEQGLEHPKRESERRAAATR
jgi:hypothetical protein